MRNPQKQNTKNKTQNPKKQKTKHNPQKNQTPRKHHLQNTNPKKTKTPKNQNTKNKKQKHSGEGYKRNSSLGVSLIYKNPQQRIGHWGNVQNKLDFFLHLVIRVFFYLGLNCYLCLELAFYLHIQLCLKHLDLQFGQISFHIQLCPT